MKTILLDILVITVGAMTLSALGLMTFGWNIPYIAYCSGCALWGILSDKYVWHKLGIE